MIRIQHRSQVSPPRKTWSARKSRKHGMVIGVASTIGTMAGTVATIGTTAGTAGTGPTMVMVTLIIMAMAMEPD